MLGNGWTYSNLGNTKQSVDQYSRGSNHVPKSGQELPAAEPTVGVGIHEIFNLLIHDISLGLAYWCTGPPIL